MNDAENMSKILVVEDDAGIRQFLYLYLRQSGFEVHGVSDGQEAIGVIPEFCPDLIVLDIKMQPVDGWEVLHWLRSHYTSEQDLVPVLVLTALTRLTEQAHGFEEGAVEYMTKPVQANMLVERILDILSLSTEQRGMRRVKHLEQRSRMVERLLAPQPDEFVY